MAEAIEVFVPGRVCLFGEHSDWAGSYRRINSNIPPGEVIISGTNQGLYARVKRHADSLVVRSTLCPADVFCMPMQKNELLKVAEGGGLYSYAAGVAYHMLTFYHIDGLEIDNYNTDLPVKKGLSSSAALCVLVARAFNKAYDLKLTVRAEMEAAYQGEILTPSRCGRMDQGCAFGQVPVQMTFDGELLKTHQLSVSKHIPLLVADLNGKKDTIKILADLNRAYPFPEDELTNGVHEYLGTLNAQIARKAITALEQGDAQALGELMTEAQALFDEKLIPACPEELTAPKLHEVLNDPAIEQYVFGGKGVGSQGDGCVQFVARGSDERIALGQYLETQYGLTWFELDLNPPQTVRKALIPAAGCGTRMFPASKAAKKELFPIITPDGIAKPVILAIVEEAVEAGIEQIAIITQDDEDCPIQAFFNDPLSPEYYNRLPDWAKKYYQRIREYADRITFLPQTSQEGFGHAVYCARDWVGDEPVLLMLGDHLYLSTTDKPCAKQLIEAFEHDRCSTIGVYVEDIKNVSHYGTITGTWVNGDNRILAVSELAEKPNADYARSNLVTPNLDNDKFLCIYGQYVLTPRIFAELGRDIDADARQAGEIQLTTALESLRKAEGMYGLVVDGKHYDTGLPGPYVSTINAMYGKG